MVGTATDASEMTMDPDETYPDASAIYTPTMPKPTTTHTTRLTAATTITPTTTRAKTTPTSASGCVGYLGLGTLQTPQCWWWLAVLVGLAAIVVVLAVIAAQLCWRCVKDRKRNK